MERNHSDSIRCIEKSQPEYPEKLKAYDHMPEKLYIKGWLPDSQRPCAAIVGARMCSPYGRIQAFQYAETLAAAGVQVISGMATGIDSEGHRGALAGGMPTWAVLGSGPDVCYPAANRNLYERILREKGGIISEYPPGTQPRNYHFPARNRILSALSDLVLVVEAKEKSGSLITAQWALEQGKAVFALPGPVNEELSRGCHRLIYDGAGLAYKPEVLLEELGINCKNTVKSSEKKNLGLASDLNMVYSCLGFRPKSRDSIMQETGLSAEKTGSILVELSILGLVREISRHYYVKIQT
jgi:DNA processing protein